MDLDGQVGIRRKHLTAGVTWYWPVVPVPKPASFHDACKSIIKQRPNLGKQLDQHYWRSGNDARQFVVLAFLAGAIAGGFVCKYI